MDARPKHSADGCHMCMLLTPAKETCPKMASLPALMVLVAKKGSFLLPLISQHHMHMPG